MNSKEKQLKLKRKLNRTIQNGSIPEGLTSTSALFPINTSNTSNFSPNDYMGPTSFALVPVQTISEEYSITVSGDWTGKVNPGDKITLKRGNIRNIYTASRCEYYSNPDISRIFFSVSNREGVSLLDPFIGTSGYTSSSPETYASFDREVEISNDRENFVKNFSVKVLNDSYANGDYSIKASWDVSPEVKAVRFRWRSIPRNSFTGDLSFSTLSSGYYSQVPSVQLVSDRGRSAKVELSGEIYQVEVLAGGTGYSYAYASFNGGGGTGASFSVGLSGSSVDNISIILGGTGYTSLPEILITGDGSGASAQVSSMNINSIHIIQQGGGYVSSPDIEVDQTYRISGTASFSASLSLDNSGKVDYIKVLEGGQGYTGASVSITGGVVDATAEAVVENGSIVSVNLLSRGYGYTASGASVSVTPHGSGSGAVLSAEIDIYSSWNYTDPVYFSNELEISGFKKNVPYEIEILASEDQRFRGIQKYSNSRYFQWNSFPSIF